MSASPKSESVGIISDAVEVDRSGRLGVWIYIAWLTTGVVEGPVRGGLSVLGAANVLYLRDLIVVFGIALGVIRPLLRGVRPAPGLVLGSWILAIHLCVGILISKDIFNSFFGLKIFLPILYSMAIFPAIERNFDLFIRAMVVFLVISVGGVFANDLIGEMPWEGMTYDTAFGTVQTTRVWWMEVGLRRLPGLARSSVDVAMIIGVTATILMALAKSVWVRLILFGLSTWAIVLSTSKGMLLAFCLAALWLVPSGRSARSMKWGRMVTIVMLLLTCVIPTIFMVVTVPEHPAEIPALLSSAWDRFSWMWPSGYSLLPDYYGALTGAGLGSIGSPLGLLPVPNSADSIFVYYYVSFGLLGLLYLSFPMFAIIGRNRDIEGTDFIYAGLLIIAYGYGLSTNMIEQSFFTCIFGLVYAKAFSTYLSRRSIQ